MKCRIGDEHWLVKTPVAHRGLHAAEKGIPENSFKAYAAAIEKGYPIERYLAKWNDLSVKNCVIKHNSYGAYNAMAGHNRNQEMLNAVLNNEDSGCVVAFWDGYSKGTQNMINISRKAGIFVKIVKI